MLPGAGTAAEEALVPRPLALVALLVLIQWLPASSESLPLSMGLPLPGLLYSHRSVLVVEYSPWEPEPGH